MRLVTFAAALWGAFIVVFVNPINSKLYSQFTTQDWVWLRIANIGTLLLALALWWFVQRFLARKIDEKARA